MTMNTDLATDKVYQIKATYYYQDGTYNAPDDGLLVDYESELTHIANEDDYYRAKCDGNCFEHGDECQCDIPSWDDQPEPLQFDTQEAAEQYLIDYGLRETSNGDWIKDGDYIYGHGEYERPRFRIV